MKKSSQRGERNEQAFMTELYKKHERLMFFVAKQYAADTFEAEEIMQNALVRLLQKEETLQGLNTYAKVNYIVTTVRHTAINYRKKRDREQQRQISLQTVPEEEEVLQLPPVDMVLILGEWKRELLEAYEGLSEDEQYLLSGKYTLSLSDEELAQQLQCKPSSIRMKLTRVRRKLMAELEREGIAHE